MKVAALVLASFLAMPAIGSAEVVKVTVNARTSVANGQTFGAAGAYEKLTGTIEFALDPGDPHNKGIVDLDRAPRSADGKVHFTSDLYVIQPVDRAKGNGALFFEIANRGNKSLLSRFNSARAAADPSAPADFGNGYLMREGYTLVWVGWEFDVDAGVRMMPPPVPGITERISVRTIPNARSNEAAFTDAPDYPPANPDDPASTLTVRTRFWEQPVPIARDQWAFIPGGGAPRISLKTGFEPGRTYEVSYFATGAVVSGAGFAATRDAAAAFRYRTDLPVQGGAAYIFGASQSGRFLREFVSSGFNADEKDRKVFDAVWAHIAGAAEGLDNARFAMPTSLYSFVATREPFLPDDLVARYQVAQRPRLIFTNTDVEYWGGGRAAALTHVTRDGRSDARISDNARIYFLAGTQHGEAAFPPPERNATGQQLPNPVPQREVMRALLSGVHHWIHGGVAPPASRYPKLSDGTLTAVASVKFPAIPGVRDPRTIPGPGLVTQTSTAMLPFLVPQVDADGNDISGIRVPDQMVPLATTTGWNFRGEQVGNPADIFALLGSYIPFATTTSNRQARNDPRKAVAERYTGKDDYLGKVRAAADGLIRNGYLLSEDLPNVLERANAHWDYAHRAPTTTSAQR